MARSIKEVHTINYYPNVIMANRKKLKNPNGLFLGVPGSGKSFAAKRELVNVFLATKDRIIVVDPMGEYSPLIRRLGGQVIEIAPDSPHHINPMDIDLSFDEENPMALKADFIRDCLDYGKDPEKTESGKYISAYECDPGTVADEFLLAKASYAGDRHDQSEH